jgi:hypothetical protein
MGRTSALGRSVNFRAKPRKPVRPPYLHHLLWDGVSYRELGGDYFDQLNAQRLTRYHTQRLAALGYAVTLTKSAA